MPTQRKIFTVQNLTQKLKDAKALVLADYRGLDVSQMNKLRAQIKKAGGEFEVVKNTLLRLAAKESQYPLAEIKFEEPTAALWLYSEDTAPLKALNDFIKETSLPKIKFGFWDQKLISLERIKELASLPGFNELKAKLVSTLQSPLFGLVNGLNWNLRKLVYVLQAKGGEENG
jgi:large subunit ribosomal protein L10